MKLFTFIALALTLHAAAQEAFKLTVKNGGMTQGFDIPADWQKDEPGEVVRDAAGALAHRSRAARRSRAEARRADNAGTDEEIARGVETVVKTVREKLPKTRVLLLGILPRQNEFFSSRIQRIDALLAKLDDGKTVRFLDLGAHFQRTPGKGDVLPELFNDDRLHLSAKGYEVFADALQPLFDEMMKLPPL